MDLIHLSGMRWVKAKGNEEKKAAPHVLKDRWKAKFEAVNTQPLLTPIEYAKGVGPARGQALRQELGVQTLGDLLMHLPFRYVDRTRYYTIQEIPPTDSEVQLVGTLMGVHEVIGKGRRRLTATLEDPTGSVDLVWFQGISWVKKNLVEGERYVIFGKPNRYQDRWSFAHPELEKWTEHQKSISAGLWPVYSTTEKLTAMGLNARGISKVIAAHLEALLPHLEEYLDPELMDALHLMPRSLAMRIAHFPTSQEALEKARFRLKFEELFTLQLGLLRQRQLHREKFRGNVFKEVGHWFNAFYHDHLPFELTGAQKRVLKEIRKDLGSGAHMNRLIQGDVGSGKTVVALMTMLLALDNGFQACMMAPTEILARQHHQTLSELLHGLEVRVALLTGSTKPAERRQILSDLREGSLPLVVGTHALIEDTVAFQNLGLAVIDEQHRFGVAQRAALWNKNTLPPHVLVMTATPIPRTLAMTLYGDLDSSVIDELPPGRKPIQTMHRTDGHRLRLHGFMREQIAAGRQVYVVFPLIEESTKLDYKNLLEGYNSLLEVFRQPDYQISIVHGQLSPEDKEEQMRRFVQGTAQIMVATTVIEVGVNVPNASVMVIESAERFGLSQLHQLRGRVGRGADQSYCILMTADRISDDARIRMETMVRTNNGFEIADVDLRLRGPGDLMGTRQSGALQLRVADLALDQSLVVMARTEAIKVLEADPTLSAPRHAALQRAIAAQTALLQSWGRIS
jgi:ATP-dependent DNA helicase RecG